MGQSLKRIRAIRNGMVTRCTNKNRKDYMKYGGRGITVCDEWLGADGSKRFCEWAISNGYDDSLTIDRIDGSKGYSPDNCRWVTMSEQNRNKRTNHIIEYRGEAKTITEWASLLGLRRDTLRRRIVDFGWPIEEALNTPTLPGKERRSHRSRGL